MMRCGIARFVGSWVSASGHCLRIKKVRKDQASVDFLDPNGTPVRRAYMNGAPSAQMVARYDDYNGIFAVELWEHGRGFILHLSHEYDYELDEWRREALVPAITRYERDRFLNQHSRLFGPLNHFVRTKKDNSQSYCDASNP